MSNELKLPDGIDLETARSVLQDYAQTDDAKIVSEGTVDALQDEIDEFKQVFAEVLSEDSPQSAETLAKQDAEGLTEPFRDAEGEIEVDTLRQSPETGDPDGGDGDGNDGGNGGNGNEPNLDALSGSQQRRITERLLPKRSSYKQRGMEKSVEKIETEILEMTGGEDFEDVEGELETLEREVNAGGN